MIGVRIEGLKVGEIWSLGSSTQWCNGDHRVL